MSIPLEDKETEMDIADVLATFKERVLREDLQSQDVWFDKHCISVEDFIEVV